MLCAQGLIDGRREKWWNIPGSHDKVMIVLEYNVDIRNATCVYYSQRGKFYRSTKQTFASIIEKIKTMFLSTCDFNLKEKSLQCFLFLPNIFWGTAYNFQGALCILSHLSGCVIIMVIRWT
ncbi:hypothetical protein CMV_030501 [Castanea mollissima]|uniref:Uncharacterized protein n=1 Tax=Castanea mollissima TaxID=60419 RepID=A0A8J4Q457_9ROSI|nr:hypothetical protein CMV_030501 [Castanea mollissima]